MRMVRHMSQQRSIGNINTFSDSLPKCVRFVSKRLSSCGCFIRSRLSWRPSVSDFFRSSCHLSWISQTCSSTLCGVAMALCCFRCHAFYSDNLPCSNMLGQVEAKATCTSQGKMHPNVLRLHPRCHPCHGSSAFGSCLGRFRRHQHRRHHRGHSQRWPQQCRERGGAWQHRRRREHLGSRCHGGKRSSLRRRGPWSWWGPNRRRGNGGQPWWQRLGTGTVSATVAIAGTANGVLHQPQTLERQCVPWLQWSSSYQRQQWPPEDHRERPQQWPPAIGTAAAAIGVAQSMRTMVAMVLPTEAVSA
mmetsp:Transcript_61340/g.121401  ORF Transcript_61340/g.121401 Transcript_61340/m.121401 type:complete len:303 (+) Transcript_61340:204-1112(+)